MTDEEIYIRVARLDVQAHGILDEARTQYQSTAQMAVNTYPFNQVISALVEYEAALQDIAGQLEAFSTKKHYVLLALEPAKETITKGSIHVKDLIQQLRDASNYTSVNSPVYNTCKSEMYSFRLYTEYLISLSAILP